MSRRRFYGGRDACSDVWERIISQRTLVEVSRSSAGRLMTPRTGTHTRAWGPARDSPSQNPPGGLVPVLFNPEPSCGTRVVPTVLRQPKSGTKRCQVDE